MLTAAPELCVQLVLDNCNNSGSSGLAVNVPVGWRLASGSASTNTDCDVHDFDPASQPALTGTGAIRWEEAGRQISGLEIDVSLRIASSEGDPELPTQVTVQTEDPLASVEICD